MATVNLYLDTRRMKKDGTFPIKLNIFHKKQIIISMGFYAFSEEWSENEYSKKQAKNIALRNLVSKVERLILSLEDSGKLKQMTDHKLKEQILLTIYKGFRRIYKLL